MTEPFNTQVPNIIDDLGLDPFERALYVHYKRVCGNNQGGYSNETVDTIHKKLRMSAGQVSEARKSLAERGLIQVQDSRPVVVTIIDIWNLNKTYYQLERQQRPDIEGWTIERLRLWLSDFHPVKLSSHNDSNLPSPSETSLTEDNNMSTDIHPVNEKLEQFHTVKLEDDMSTQFHKVKQRSKPESIESNSLGISDKSPPKNGLTPGNQESAGKLKQEMVYKLSEICKINLSTASGKQKGQLGTMADSLIKTGVSPPRLDKFIEWWYANEWRGQKGQAPEPHQVGEEWGRFEDSLKSKKLKVSAL